MNVVIIESQGNGKFGCKFYTCMSDAADDFGVNKATMYRWAKKGKPRDKDGNRVYFDAEVIKSRNRAGINNFK